MNHRRRRWPARGTPGASVVLARDQASVPSQESLRADDGGKLKQAVSPELVALGRQPAALVMVEPGLSVQLFPQDLYLLLEVFNDELLLAVEPTSQADEHELQSVHRPIPAQPPLLTRVSAGNSPPGLPQVSRVGQHGISGRSEPRLRANGSSQRSR